MTRARSSLKSIAGAVAALLALAVLPGCATLIDRIVDAQIKEYFHDAGPPPTAPVQYELAKLPFSEYWTGIVFNGEKIGFTRFSVRPAEGRPQQYQLDSEASFVLRFLGFEKRINLRARDVVHADLSLSEFAYDYHIDGSDLRLTGRRDGGGLGVTIVSGGQPTEQRLTVEGKLYPSSVIALYPVLHGLVPGREYRYRVFSGELQGLAEVTQHVAAYEKSRLFYGNAFRIETAMSGQRVRTWIDHQGRPVFELGSNGVMISALEEPEKARSYVALASLNKKESLVEFSLVRPDRRIENPRSVSALKLVLSGIDRLPPSDATQRCSQSGAEIHCETRVAGVAETDAAAEAARARYLQPSVTVQSNDASIRRTAQSIVGGAATPFEQVARLIQWMQDNVEKTPLDVFSALDVLEKRRAECQGHAYLYTAFARALGIPTRIVNGIAYSQDFDGFLYHSWAESLVDGNWVGVDPTFSQTVADATHVKLVEGESLADLLPLLDWVGKVKIRVLEVEHQKP